MRRGEEILAGLRLIELLEFGARLVFVAGVTAERGQRVRRHRHEVVEGQAPRDVFDVRVEAAVLVHDEDAGQLPGGVGRAAHVHLDLAVALRRVDLDPLGLEALVVLGHLLRLGELRIQHVEQHHRGHAADRELGRAVEEGAPIDVPMHVVIEDGPELGIEIFRGQTFALLRFLHVAPSVQFSVHSEMLDTSLTKTRCPDNTGCAQVALSATV